MKLLRKYIVALIAGILVLILVILRLTGWNRFTKTANEFQSLTAGRDYIISLNDNQRKLPVIDIRDIEEFSASHPEGAINIPADNLLSAESRGFLTKNQNGIILYSDNYAKLLRVWSILCQMGYKNIFVASNGIETDEILKYKFRPDTTIKPE